MSNNIKNTALFLPYQTRWLEDKSRIKIWEKSRRIGATYVQSYEDVYDALNLKIHNKPCDVWFSSANESAAIEYIKYCEFWAKMFNSAVKKHGKCVIDEKHSIKAFSLEFKNGARINALTSNPKQFRSKGGKVVLDEFAFHNNQDTLWTSAKPCITWGYPLRIISTHNGQNCLFYKFLKQIASDKLKWSHHRTPIFTAVNEGLVSKILGHDASKENCNEWLEQEKQNCADEITWAQEYCCIAVDEATAFITYEMINSIKEPDIIKPIDSLKGDLYLGMDIGRYHDFSVITILEQVKPINFLRHQIVLKAMKFREQKEILYKFLSKPNMRRACLDGTGLGSQLAEDAVLDFGISKVEKIIFSSKSKEDMAYKLYTTIQNRELLIDILTPDEEIEDYHSIKKFKTSSNNTRFDSDNSTDGHADRFWSLALANYASLSKKSYKKPVIYSAKPDFMSNFMN